MNKITCLLLGIVFLISCEKDKGLGKVCNYQEIPFDIDIQSNAIIPLHSQNFWVYSDSLWEVSTGNFESEKSTLLKIDKVYDLDGLKSIKFSSIIPQLTLRNDTLFSTILTPEQSSANCFKLLYPMFFSTIDSIEVDDEPSDKFVYRDITPVETSIGTYSDNIIYNEENLFEVIINEEIGIIKISFFIPNGNKPSQKRRTLTLKDYDLK
jgi:hypothetical protein